MASYFFAPSYFHSSLFDGRNPSLAWMRYCGTDIFANILVIVINFPPFVLFNMPFFLSATFLLLLVYGPSPVIFLEGS